MAGGILHGNARAPTEGMPQRSAKRARPPPRAPAPGGGGGGSSGPIAPTPRRRNTTRPGNTTCDAACCDTRVCYGSDDEQDCDGMLLSSGSESELDAEEGSTQYVDPHVRVEIPATEAEATELEAEEASARALLEGMSVTPTVDADSPAWHAKVDGCVQQLAAGLRDCPTVPPDPTHPSNPWLDPDDGTLWPAKHCAFKHCVWHGEADAQLEAHLHEQHGQAFRYAEQWLESREDGRAVKHFRRTWRGLYNEAIALKEREGVPTVGSCPDRRAFGAFSRRHSGENLCAPMCACCARVLPYDQSDVDRMVDEETALQPEIQWRKVIGRNRFCGMTRQQTEDAIGMRAYMREYGHGEKGPDLRTECAQRELRDWSMVVPFAEGPVEIMSCPEDRRCSSTECKKRDMLYCKEREDGTVNQGRALCTECEVPMCRECWKALSKAHKRPKLSLANDLWTGYIPKVTHEPLHKSPCHTYIYTRTLSL